MKFSPSALLAAAAALLLPSLSAFAEYATSDGREFYELRLYRLTSEAAAETFDAMMEKGALPAFERAGIGPVGVFVPKEKHPEDGDAVLRYVLIPHASLSGLVTLKSKLGADALLHEHLGAYLGTPMAEPVFSRVESSLLQAFAGMPKLKLPGEAKDPGKRYFELRTYESHNELKGELKVEMFNAGEIDIFASVGLHPVFMGQALVASNLPQLTYLLVYENEDDHKTAWDAFRSAPAWEKLKNDPRFADTVSKIHSLFLVATPYSAIR